MQIRLELSIKGSALKNFLILFPGGIRNRCVYHMWNKIYSPPLCPSKRAFIDLYLKRGRIFSRLYVFKRCLHKYDYTTFLLCSNQHRHPNPLTASPTNTHFTINITRLVCNWYISHSRVLVPV